LAGRIERSVDAGRCCRTVLLCDTGEPRDRHSAALHGYLTRDGIAPAEFNELGRAELRTYGIESRHLRVIGAERVGRSFRVSLDDGRVEASRFILIATGVTDHLPPIAGIEACYGRSVHHCPYCDGWEWRDRRLAVLGSGMHGARLAQSLKTWSRNVTLCLDGTKLDRRMRQRLDAWTETASACDTLTSAPSRTRTACSIT